MSRNISLENITDSYECPVVLVSLLFNFIIIKTLDETLNNKNDKLYYAKKTLALNKIGENLGIDPSFKSVSLLKATLLYQEAKEFEKMEELIEKLGPKNIKPYLFLRKEPFSRKNIERAKKVLNSHNEKEIKSASYLAIGFVYLEKLKATPKNTDLMKSAIHSFSKSFEETPSLNSVLGIVQIYSVIGIPKAAVMVIDAFKKHFKGKLTNVEKTELELTNGHVYTQLMDLKGVDIYRSILDIYKDKLEILLYIANLYRKLGEHETDVIAVLREALALPECIENKRIFMKYCLALGLLELGKIKKKEEREEIMNEGKEILETLIKLKNDDRKRIFRTMSCHDIMEESKVLLEHMIEFMDK